MEHAVGVRERIAAVVEDELLTDFYQSDVGEQLHRGRLCCQRGAQQVPYCTVGSMPQPASAPTLLILLVFFAIHISADVCLAAGD
jgi:hypothetical protein